MAVAVDSRSAPSPEARRRRWRPGGLGGWLVWGAVAFFFVNLAGLIATVALDAFGKTWFGGWIPDGFTVHWFSDAWADFTVNPGFMRAKVWTHWLRRLPRSSQPGVIRGFIWMGMRTCGDRAGSMPVKPGAETPTMVMG